MAFWPTSPPINTEARDWSWKSWFQSLFRWMTGSSVVSAVISADLTLSDRFYYPVSASGATVQVTLPSAVSNPYKKYLIRKTDSSTNTVVVGVTGSDTIDADSSHSLTLQYEGVVVQSDGLTTWHRVSYLRPGFHSKLRADFSNATIASRYPFQSSTTNGNTILTVIPNGTATTSAYQCYNGSDLTAAISYADIRITSATVQITSQQANSGTVMPIQVNVGGNVSTIWDINGSVRLGLAIATTATDGFPYIPATAGAPTGVPTAKTGFVACQYDTTNNKLWVYNGAWKGVVLA